MSSDTIFHICISVVLATMPIWMPVILMSGERNHDDKNRGVAYFKDTLGIDKSADEIQRLTHQYRTGKITIDEYRRQLKQFN